MKMSCDYKTDLCIHTETNRVSIKLYFLSQQLNGYITRNNLKGIIINNYSLKSRLTFCRYSPRLKIVLVYSQEVISSIDEKETIKSQSNWRLNLCVKNVQWSMRETIYRIFKHGKEKILVTI